MSDPGARPDLVGVTQSRLSFVDCHVDDSYRLAHAMLADATSATDAVADAFMAVVRQCPSTGPEAPGALVGVLYRSCVEIRAAAGTSHRGSDANGRQLSGSRDGDLWSLLPPTIGDSVALAMFGRCSVAEIAVLTGLTVRGVCCRLSVALAVARAEYPSTIPTTSKAKRPRTVPIVRVA